MATFVCTRCGKCCMSLGRHIRIERSLSPVQHYVRDAISGEVTLVSIHPDNRALFSEGALEGGCPFLRKGGDAPFTCTIYEMRPASAGSSGAGPWSSRVRTGRRQGT